MRMMPLFAVVVAMGLSITMLGALGVSGYFGETDTGLGDEFEGEAELDPDQTIGAEEGDDTGFLSFVIGGAREITNLVGLIVFLPSTLQSLGFPGAASRALGHGIQLVITLGIIQVYLQWEVR